MTREQAINYLRSSGFSEEQIQEIVKALEQEPILDKIRAEIAEYGSICVEYKLTLTDRRDKDIEQLVTDVLKQAFYCGMNENQKVIKKKINELTGDE